MRVSEGNDERRQMLGAGSHPVAVLLRRRRCPRCRPEGLAAAVRDDRACHRRSLLTIYEWQRSRLQMFATWPKRVGAIAA